MVAFSHYAIVLDIWISGEENRNHTGTDLPAANKFKITMIMTRPLSLSSEVSYTRPFLHSALLRAPPQ